MKNPTDFVGAVFILVICAIGAYSVSSLPEASGLDLYGPASFPKSIIVLLAICGICLLIQSIKIAAPKDYWKDGAVLKKLSIFIFLFYAYICSLSYLGDYFITLEDIYVPAGTAFIITTTTFLLFALPLLGRKKKLENLFTSVMTTSCLYGVFGIFFQVLLP